MRTTSRPTPAATGAATAALRAEMPKREPNSTLTPAVPFVVLREVV
jgi:hypothetical protein